MAAGKRILRGKQAREVILRGMLEVANTVSSTYGPQGRTVLFDKGGNARNTKDGITVAKEIKFTDEAKNLGAMLIKEAASKSNYFSGDGSTSTTILTAELCKQAHLLLNQGIGINDLRDGYTLATEKVTELLNNYKYELKSEEDIFNIAKISANGDEDIANNIKEAFLSIGDNGIVSIADSLSRKGETTVKISTGLEFDRGFLSSQSVNASNDQCILSEPKVLISSDILNSVEDLQIIVQSLQISKIPVVIIAPDFSDEVMAWFRELLSKKSIEGSLVLAPGISKQNVNDRLNDLAIMLDAEILGQTFSLSEYKDDYLGSAEQIIISKGKTIIIDAHTDNDKFDKYISLLQAKVDNDSAEIGYSEYEIESIKERIAKMTGGVATILVGALTSVELGEKKDRYEDAVNAVRAMLTEGYLPGGGSTLLRISYEAADIENVSMLTAYKSFMKAMRKPIQLLIDSSGNDQEVVIPSILKQDGNYGYNARKRQIENIIETGIIDPYKVIKNSVIYASNVAIAFMSMDSVIVTDVPNLTIESLDEVLNDDGVRL